MAANEGKALAGFEEEFSDVIEEGQLQLALAEWLNRAALSTIGVSYHSTCDIASEEQTRP
jgi:hypothetical protein